MKLTVAGDHSRVIGEIELNDEGIALIISSGEDFHIGGEFKEGPEEFRDGRMRRTLKVLSLSLYPSPRGQHCIGCMGVH